MHWTTSRPRGAIRAQILSTDRKDARGIAQLLRMGWFRQVHCKGSEAQEVRALLVGRKLLQSKMLDVESGIRGLLRGFGLKMGTVSKGRFAARARELKHDEFRFADIPSLPSNLRILRARRAGEFHRWRGKPLRLFGLQFFAGSA